MKSKSIVIISFVVLIIAILAVSASYGFFEYGYNNNILGNYIIEFGERFNFSVSGGSASDIEIDDLSFFGTSYDAEIYSGDITITLTLENLDTVNSISCTYDYAWRWDLTLDKYVASSSEVNEYTISGPFSERQVPDYNALNFIIGSGNINASAGGTTNKDVTLTTKFYNLAEVNQENHAGKSYRGGVVIDNISCS